MWGALGSASGVPGIPDEQRPVSPAAVVGRGGSELKRPWNLALPRNTREEQVGPEPGLSVPSDDMAKCGGYAVQSRWSSPYQPRDLPSPCR